MTTDFSHLREQMISDAVAAYTKAAPALVDAALRALAARGVLDPQVLAALVVPTPPAATEPPRMKVKDFAAARGYSAKTVSRWCAAGMPSVGGGSGRRVLVSQADAWLKAGGAKGSAERAARRSARPSAH